jgi:hypothetical protein
VYKVLLQLKGENCVFCEECETIAKELGEAYADAWASCDQKTKEAWVAVYKMIGGDGTRCGKSRRIDP